MGNSTSGISRSRKGDVRNVLDTDTAVGGSRLRENNLHSSVSGIRNLSAQRTGFAGIIKKQCKVALGRSRKGNATKGIQETGLQIVASIHKYQLLLIAVMVTLAISSSDAFLRTMTAGVSAVPL